MGRRVKSGGGLGSEKLLLRSVAERMTWGLEQCGAFWGVNSEDVGSAEATKFTFDLIHSETEGEVFPGRQMRVRPRWRRGLETTPKSWLRVGLGLSYVYSFWGLRLWFIQT